MIRVALLAMLLAACADIPTSCSTFDMADGILDGRYACARGMCRCPVEKPSSENSRVER